MPAIRFAVPVPELEAHVVCHLRNKTADLLKLLAEVADQSASGAEQLVAGNGFIDDADVMMTSRDDSFGKVDKCVIAESGIPEHNNAIGIFATAQNIKSAEKRHKITGHRTGRKAELFLVNAVWAY